MALDIYAGASLASLTKLPSPSQVTPTFEIIWSEDTGRAQSGSDKAKMIGSVVDEKKTYAIKWGVIDNDDMNIIKSHLTRGFFYFCVGTEVPTSSNNYNGAVKYYRSEIAGDYLPIGNDIYWKDVTVSVIEQ